MLSKCLYKPGLTNAKSDGMTAFIWACAKNPNPEVIKAFLRFGANIDSKTDSGTTMLMWAAGMNANPEIINTLISEGADVNEKRSGDDMTALMCAAWMNSNPNVIKALLQAGAEKDAKNSAGMTAKDFASDNDNSAIILRALE